MRYVEQGPLALVPIHDGNKYFPRLLRPFLLSFLLPARHFPLHSLPSLVRGHVANFAPGPRKGGRVRGGSGEAGVFFRFA